MRGNLYIPISPRFTFPLIDHTFVTITRFPSCNLEMTVLKNRRETTVEDESILLSFS